MQRDGCSLYCFFNSHVSGRKSRILHSQGCEQIRAIKPNLVSFNVNKLVEEGYLERVAMPGNRRSIRLVCTEKAQPVIEKGRAVKRRFFLDLMNGMSENDIARFHGYMELIGNNVMKMKQSLKEGKKENV